MSKALATHEQSTTLHFSAGSVITCVASAALQQLQKALERKLSDLDKDKKEERKTRRAGHWSDWEDIWDFRRENIHRSIDAIMLKAEETESEEAIMNLRSNYDDIHWTLFVWDNWPKLLEQFCSTKRNLDQAARPAKKARQNP